MGRTVCGGVNQNEQGDVLIHFEVAGGQPYTRVFPNAVDDAISRFSVITSTLVRLICPEPAKGQPQVMSPTLSKTDLGFFAMQVMLLLEHAPVEFVPGGNEFQNAYNLKLATQFLQTILTPPMRVRAIAELLSLDSMLYSLGRVDHGQENVLEFDLPVELEYGHSMAVVAPPVAAEGVGLKDYALAVVRNLELLSNTIKANMPVFKAVYGVIVDKAKLCVQANAN